MATCSPQDLLNVAKCFGCLTQDQLNLVSTSLLCQILQINNPMASCDAQTLLNDAKCFGCLTPFQLATVRTQLLCEILNVGILQTCVQCSASSDPVDAPACECALFYRRDNGNMWYWDADDAEWVITM